MKLWAGFDPRALSFTRVLNHGRRFGCRLVSSYILKHTKTVAVDVAVDLLKEDLLSAEHTSLSVHHILSACEDM